MLFLKRGMIAPSSPVGDDPGDRGDDGVGEVPAESSAAEPPSTAKLQTLAKDSLSRVLRLILA